MVNATRIAAFIVASMFAVSVFAETTLTLPAKTSQFNGLYGISIKEGARCKECCDLVFPESFGLAKRTELEFLVNIINKGDKIKHDMDCVMPLDSDVLDHIRFLAINKQDKMAASLLVYPGGHGGLKLGGGELEETYADEYIRPVLEKYSKLEDVVSPKAMKYIADKICLTWVNPTIESSMNLSELIKSLRKRQFQDLADKIEITCKKYEKELNSDE